MPLPANALVLARISDARDQQDDDRAVTDRGVTGQVEDGLALAARLGWAAGPPETHHLIENDTSAFKRRRIDVPGAGAQLRTVRPEFRRGLAMLADGRADGLIAYDLDRTCRDPRDLEDLIDVIEASRPRIPVVSVTGSLALANDADITMARVLVAVANKSSRDTGRRVARARLRSARNGEAGGGGRRRFGFERDGVTLRAGEAAEIRRATDAVLAGVSLRQVTLSLRDRDVPTVTGARWDSRTVRGILLRPRNAGLMVYRPASARRYGPPYAEDEIVGTGSWEPIVTEAEWRAVTAILADPARSQAHYYGAAPRWLGSRIYLCGACGDGALVVVTGSGEQRRKYRRYVCAEKANISRPAVPVDAFVTETILARLERPDAAALIQAGPGAPDLVSLRKQAASLRELLDEQARLHARQVIDGRQLAAGTADLRAQLGPVEAAIQAASTSSPAAGIAGKPDARQRWDELDLGRRRVLVRSLVTVTVLPSRPGPGFDSRSVRIEWRQ